MDTEPVRGGIVTLVGVDDVDSLDSAIAYHTVTRNLMRCLTRQLVSYRSGDDPARAGEVHPDMALMIPTRANGHVDQTGCVSLFPLREGLCWDDGTPLVAEDVVRGIKRLADPRRLSPGLAYFTETIHGMRQFQADIAEAPADRVGAVIESTSLPGVVALGENMVQVRTTGPVPDLMNLLALPFASPAPPAYLAHPPGSGAVTAQLRSCGPYAVQQYRPGHEIHLVRNRRWVSDRDPLRAAWVDEVHIREGLTEEQAHHSVLAGTADLLWDTQPLTGELPHLLSPRDPRLEVHPAGLLSPYLVVNFDGDVQSRPLLDKNVRQALQYGIDKDAVARVWGGEQLNTIARQLLPTTCSARLQQDFYPSADDHGDPQRSHELLGRAGFEPHEVGLRLVHRDSDIHPQTAEVVAASLRRSGFDVELIPTSTAGLFEQFLADPTPNRGWDVALTGWEPDWHGSNMRTYLLPLLDSRHSWGSNFGHYVNPRINRLFDSAMTALDPDFSVQALREIETIAMEEAALAPILFAHQYWMHSAAVKNWLPYPILNGDLTQLWLNRATPDEIGVLL